MMRRLNTKSRIICYKNKRLMEAEDVYTHDLCEDLVIVVVNVKICRSSNFILDIACRTIGDNRIRFIV